LNVHLDDFIQIHLIRSNIVRGIDLLFVKCSNLCFLWIKFVYVSKQEKPQIMLLIIFIGILLQHCHGTMVFQGYDYLNDCTIDVAAFDRSNRLPKRCETISEVILEQRQLKGEKYWCFMYYNHNTSLSSEIEFIFSTGYAIEYVSTPDGYRLKVVVQNSNIFSVSSHRHQTTLDYLQQ
jgi:hypothetical protein